MNPAIATLIIEGVAALAPYIAQLAGLAAKLKAGEAVTEADLAAADAGLDSAGIVRTAFAALRRELTAPET